MTTSTSPRFRSARRRASHGSGPSSSCTPAAAARGDRRRGGQPRATRRRRAPRLVARVADRSSTARRERRAVDGVERAVHVVASISAARPTGSDASSPDPLGGRSEAIGELVLHVGLQAHEALEAELRREPDDGRSARAGPAGHLGDGAEGDALGLGQHDVGDPALGGRQGRAVVLDVGWRSGHGTDVTMTPNCRNGGYGDRMATFDSVNPARPAEVVGTFPSATAADVDRAVAAATEAQREWARRPVPGARRADRRRGDVLAARKAELAALVAARPARSSSRRAATCRRRSTWAASSPGRAAPRWARSCRPSCTNKMAWTTRQPVGVVGMITPWNFPVAIPSWKIFPALLAGNGIVLKPSEHTPACAEAFVDALRRGGHPRRPACRSCTAHGEPGAALAVHPGVGAVSASPARCRPAAWWRRAAMATGPAAGSPRARRQERDGRARRRRPRPRDRRRALRRLRHVGPALHLDLAARRAPRRRRRSSSSAHRRSAPRRSCSATRLDADHRRRPGDRPPLGRAHRRDDRGRGRRRRRRSRPAAHLVEVDGCEGGTFVAPTILTRRASRPHDRPRRGVRPGAVGHRGRRRSTRRSTS